MAGTITGKSLTCRSDSPSDDITRIWPENGSAPRRTYAICRRPTTRTEPRRRRDRSSTDEDRMSRPAGRICRGWTAVLRPTRTTPAAIRRTPPELVAAERGELDHSHRRHRPGCRSSRAKNQQPAIANMAMPIAPPPTQRKCHRIGSGRSGLHSQRRGSTNSRESPPAMPRVTAGVASTSFDVRWPEITSTGATKRYPLPEIVSTNPGASGSRRGRA